MGYIDLHTHTNFSDGSLTPSELIRRAHEINLKAVAITDHDTIDGLKSGADAAVEYGIEFVNGIEIASYYLDRIEIHILGLTIDTEHQMLRSKISDLRKAREDRNIQIIENLQQTGIDISIEKINAGISYNQLSRAHFAGYLLDKGYVSTINDAYRRYLSVGSPTYVKRALLSYEDSISTIIEAGGVPILAHPMLYGLDYYGIEELIKMLKNAGLMGIETMHSSQTSGDEIVMSRLAKKYGLCMSGGSDFHGSIKKGIELGVGKGQLSIPYKFLRGIKAARDRG